MVLDIRVLLFINDADDAFEGGHHSRSPSQQLYVLVIVHVVMVRTTMVAMPTSGFYICWFSDIDLHLWTYCSMMFIQFILICIAVIFLFLYGSLIW
jgi:hypothetical protein